MRTRTTSGRPLGWPCWTAIAVIVILCCSLPQFLLNGSIGLDIRSDSFNKNNLEQLNFDFSAMHISEENGEVDAAIEHEHHGEFHSDHQHDSFLSNKMVSKVAIIVPYVGDSLPSWFDAFCMTAAASSSLYDWIILVTDAPLRHTPPNVKLVKMSKDDIYKRIARLDDSILLDVMEDSKQKDRVDVSLVRKLFTLQPYMMVELKPCFGFLFKDILTPYSHWAYADVDQLIGRLQNLIPLSSLKQYDIVTTSFGDNYRMYIRGQLSIHRNDPFVNNLWRSCSHLSHIGERLKKFRDSDFKTWKFHSAEGCYSRVVADHPEVSLLVSSSQISDAYHTSVPNKESFYLGNALFRCYEQPLLRMSKSDNEELYQITSDTTLSKIREHITKDVDTFLLKSTTKASLKIQDYMCAYWLPPEFQVCLSLVPADVDISSINGSIVHSQTDQHKFFSSCREGSTTHFQGWKKNYYHFMTRSPPLDSRALVISETGFIPLRLLMSMPGNSLRGGANRRISQLPTFGELRGTYIPNGRVHATDIFAGDAASKKSIKADGDKSKFAVTRLLHAGSESDSIDNKGKSLAANYCAKFSADLKRCICPILSENIKIAKVAKHSRYEDVGGRSGIFSFPVEADEVTMVSAAWQSEFYDGYLDDMLNAWIGPKIIVLGAIGTKDLKPLSRNDVTVLEVDLAPCLLQGDHTKSDFVLPDATLLNIGLDASGTDLVAVFPKGFVPQRHIDAHVGNLAALSIRKQMANAQGLERSRKSAYPVALLLPSYVIGHKSNGDQEIRRHLEVKESLDSEVIRDLEDKIVTYPSAMKETAQCGNDQSKRLVVDYFKRSHEIIKYGISYGDEEVARIFKDVEFNAKEFLMPRTVPLPFVFNQSAGTHGAGFVRFPEELGGQGCFGSSIFRILVGSGFHLHWAGSHAFATTLAVAGSTNPTLSNLDSKSEACSCAHSDLSKPEKLLNFAIMLNKYFHRVVELRANALGGLFADEGFGKHQQEEQEGLIAKSEAAKSSETETAESQKNENTESVKKNKEKGSKKHKKDKNKSPPGKGRE